MNISVIIPVKNDEKRVGQCIEAVVSQTIKPLEVILVDGNSIDRTVDVARNYPIRIITENYGTIGGARQVGLESAFGDYIAFTDSDCIPCGNWLENLAKEFDKGIVGVCGGTKNMGNNLWEKSVALALNSFLGSANSVQDRVFKEKRFVKDISGCNCMYRKADLISVGGFNVTLAIDEDTELNKRLIKLGKMIYTPNAIVSHNQHRDVKGFLRRMYSFGFARGKDRLWDIQVIPPVFGLAFLPLLFINLQLLLVIISLYILIIFFFSISIALKSRDIKFIFTLPLIYLLEHIAYTIGFWRGLSTIHRKV